MNFFFPLLILLLFVRTYSKVNHLCTRSIVDETVWRSTSWVANNTGGSESDDTVCDGTCAGDSLESHQVGSKTSNVWGGHGGTRDGVAGAVARVPCGSDGTSWGEDIENGAKVGVGSSGISGCGGTDGDGGSSGRRGVVSSIGIAVTGSDGEDDTSSDGIVHGTVGSRGVRSTQTHVGNSSSDDALGSCVRGHKVDSGNDTRVRARPTGGENLHTDDSS